VYFEDDKADESRALSKIKCLTPESDYTCVALSCPDFMKGDLRLIPMNPDGEPMPTVSCPCEPESPYIEGWEPGQEIGIYNPVRLNTFLDISLPCDAGVFRFSMDSPLFRQWHRDFA
jgi:hypothetical protein